MISRNTPISYKITSCEIITVNCFCVRNPINILNCYIWKWIYTLTYRTKIPTYTIPTRNVSQTFKSSNCKKVLTKGVYHWYNLLRWCFLFHVMIGKHFLYKFIVTQRFGETAMFLCSLKLVFWKKSAFYIVISTITLPCC